MPTTQELIEDVMPLSRHARRSRLIAPLGAVGEAWGEGKKFIKKVEEMV